MSRKPRVLFLGCHNDDIEIGCGATIHKHQRDWEITCAVLSRHGPGGAYRDLWKNSTEALGSLGVQDIRFFDFPVRNFSLQRQQLWHELNQLNEELRPLLVFSQEYDSHQDHEALYAETMRIYWNATVVVYQSTLRNSLFFQPNIYEPVGRADVAAKLQLPKFYPMYKDKNYFDPKNIEARLRMTAMPVRVEFAEGFRLLTQTGFAFAPVPDELMKSKDSEAQVLLPDLLDS
jgi:LmbE family N-acetylglucosaminyl deacetylase